MRISILTFAALLAASTAIPALAQESTAAAREACMREMRISLKAGQKGFTEQQRMVAEEQCRARVEAAQQPKK